MTDETRAELLPCPFCGHEKPTFVRRGDSRQSCIIECGWCGCRHESSDEGEDNGSTWNTRAAIVAERTRCAAIARAHGAEDVAAEIEQPN